MMLFERAARVCSERHSGEDRRGRRHVGACVEWHSDIGGIAAYSTLDHLDGAATRVRARDFVGGHMNQIAPKTLPDHPAPTKSDARGARSDEDDKARMADEGGTDGQVGDRGGPGAGYDGEPAQVKDSGGVK